jgi:hypothetical protein
VATKFRLQCSEKIAEFSTNPDSEWPQGPVSSVVESLGGPQKMTPTFGYDDIIFNLFKNTKPKIQNPREAVEEMRIQKKTHIVTIAQSLSN